MMLRLALGVVAALAFSAMAVVLNARRVRRVIEGELRRLRRATEQAALEPGPTSRHNLELLPPPVQVYLELALNKSVPALRSIRFRHGGRFKSKLEGPWQPIRGEQYDSADPPGFVWWSRINVAPGIWIDARDRCVGGSGRMLVSLDSTLTLFDRSGPALDQGSMLRLLSELVLLPSVLLDGRYISWSAIDERHAMATLIIGNVSVRGVFEFDDSGLPRRFDADRYRDTGRGAAVRARWSGEYADYRRVNGWLIPHRLVGYWHEGAERLPYADFVLEAPEYDVLQPL
jgi:hypothetical protein